MSTSSQVDWESYAAIRQLGRNRLLFEEHQEVVRDFLDYFSSMDPTVRVLDVGCATGFFLTLLRELGFEHLKGIDIAEKAVAQAQNKGLACEVADVRDPDLRDRIGPVDVALLMDVLEHLPDPGDTLKRLRGLLVPTGLLYLTVPIYDAWSERLTRWRRHQTRLEQSQNHDPTHLHAFQPEQWIQLICESGFEVEATRKLFYPLPRAIPRSLRAVLSAHLPQTCKGRFLRVVARNP